MIFCGDTVFPNNYNDKVLANCDQEFLKKEKIVNLESSIELESYSKTTSCVQLCILHKI